MFHTLTVLSAYVKKAILQRHRNTSGTDSFDTPHPCLPLFMLYLFNTAEGETQDL